MTSEDLLHALIQLSLQSGLDDEAQFDAFATVAELSFAHLPPQKRGQKLDVLLASWGKHLTLSQQVAIKEAAFWNPGECGVPN
jgi:hypothetical protein